MPVDLIVCVATEMEGALLRPHLPVLVTGIGAVNTASAPFNLSPIDTPFFGISGLRLGGVLAEFVEDPHHD